MILKSKAMILKKIKNIYMEIKNLVLVAVLIYGK